MTANTRKKALETGVFAETLVAHWFSSQGSQILERNYQSRRGEVDLIVQEKEVLTFVEVRSRLHSSTKEALATIKPSKRQRIVQAAQAYIATHCRMHEPDVAFVCVGVSFRWDGSIVFRRETMEMW